MCERRRLDLTRDSNFVTAPLLVLGCCSCAPVLSEIMVLSESDFMCCAQMIMEAIAASLQETDITSSRASEMRDSASDLQAVSSQTLGTTPQGDLPAMPSGDDPGALHTTDDQRKREEHSPTSESQTVGTLEALGQRWGLGLFRAMSSKQNNNSQS